jgi:hypothetical protein
MEVFGVSIFLCRLSYDLNTLSKIRSIILPGHGHQQILGGQVAGLSRFALHFYRQQRVHHSSMQFFTLLPLFIP